DVWIPNNLLNITHPEFNQKLQPKPAEPKNGEQESAQLRKKDREAKAKKKAIDGERREAATKLKGVLRSLRKLTLDHLDKGELFPLSEADAIAGEAFKTPVRVIHHGLKAVLSEPDPKRAAKDF